MREGPGGQPFASVALEVRERILGLGQSMTGRRMDLPAEPTAGVVDRSLEVGDRISCRSPTRKPAPTVDPVVTTVGGKSASQSAAPEPIVCIGSSRPTCVVGRPGPCKTRGPGLHVPHRPTLPPRRWGLGGNHCGEAPGGRRLPGPDASRHPSRCAEPMRLAARGHAIGSRRKWDR